jgi:hypothetical protein
MLIFLEDVADENLISEIKAVSTKARLAVELALMIAHWLPSPTQQVLNQKVCFCSPRNTDAGLTSSCKLTRRYLS